MFERYNGTAFASLPLSVEEAVHAATADLATEATTAVTAQNAEAVASILAAKILECLVPVATVLPFAGTVDKVPTGYLFCDGRTVSRETYSDLFAKIGTLYGAGDGLTTFTIPNLQGKFLRCTGGNAAALGVAQGDAIRNITATVFPLDDITQHYGTATGAFTMTAQEGYCAGSKNWENATLLTFDASRQVPTAVENRPVNMAMNFIIKY